MAIVFRVGELKKLSATTAANQPVATNLTTTDVDEIPLNGGIAVVVVAASVAVAVAVAVGIVA